MNINFQIIYTFFNKIQNTFDDNKKKARGKKQKKATIIINRHNVNQNKKHKKNLPCISIRTYNEIEYAYEIKLIGKWTLLQDFENPICSGATIWLEGFRDNVQIVK